TSSCMAGNPILVEVSENQDLTTAAANRRAKFILGFAHQLGQFRYIRRDPSCLIFGERLAAEGRPGAQPKKGPGRPAKYDLRECDERCFLRAPRESSSGARVSTNPYRRRPLPATTRFHQRNRRFDRCMAARGARTAVGAYARSGRRNSRISWASASGCSIAAKWPPFAITLQRRMLMKTRSAIERGGRRISRGNSA